jgi:endonuclease YncB( thermonuclease family)
MDRDQKVRLIWWIVIFVGVFLLLFAYFASKDKTVAQELTTKALTFKRGYYCPPDQLRVIDGDTVVCKGKHIRAVGYDTPELSIKCEHASAVAAKQALTDLLATHRLLIREARELDKYGRTLGQLVLDGRTQVSAILIGQGLAHPYAGGKRPPWPGC